MCFGLIPIAKKLLGSQFDFPFFLKFELTEAMNALESFFLNSNFSWFLSKLLPYILFPIFGLILGLLFNRFFKIKKKAKKILILSLSMLLLFGIYFAYSPIYQGDFSNNSLKIDRTVELSEIQEKHLYVITIPGCPFCAESINRMKKLQKRNPNVVIDYIVCNGDSSALDWYSKEVGSTISVHLAKNNKAIAGLSKHKYPSFVFSNGKEINYWSNDGFGVSAMDEIESNFSN